MPLSIKTSSLFLCISSGSSGEHRQALKYEIMDYFYEKQLQDYLQLSKPVIICGDWNIAHKVIDIKNAKSNEKNSGFLPEEREWMDSVLNLGYVDAFREVCKEPHQYTWWSFKASRENNVGGELITKSSPKLKKNSRRKDIPSPKYRPCTVDALL